MDKRSFFIGLANLSSVPANPGTKSKAEAYRDRVLADGGTLYSYAAVVAAYDQADAWGLPPEATHWSSPRFGYKLDASGQVGTRYCLFSQDATPDAANGQWPLVPASAPGKAPQMFTNEHRFITLPFAWQSKELSAHIVALSNSWQPTDHYPYMPLLEQASIDGNGAPFLLAVESGGGAEGGTTQPGSYVGIGYYPSLSVNHAYTLAINPNAATVPLKRRVWLDGTEAQQQLQDGVMSAGVFPGNSLLLGGREATPYAWLGNINDVLVTNKLLSDAARAWLDYQVTNY